MVLGREFGRRYGTFSAWGELKLRKGMQSTIGGNKNHQEGEEAAKGTGRTRME